MHVGIDGGGARVDANFRSFLWRNLIDSDIEDKEDIPGILSDALRDFQGRGKRIYGSPSTSCTVLVGGRKMNSQVLPITKGVLSLDGQV
jgi:hypothetical protein